MSFEQPVTAVWFLLLTEMLDIVGCPTGRHTRVYPAGQVHHLAYLVEVFHKLS